MARRRIGRGRKPDEIGKIFKRSKNDCWTEYLDQVCLAAFLGYGVEEYEDGLLREYSMKN